MRILEDKAFRAGDRELCTAAVALVVAPPVVVAAEDVSSLPENVDLYSSDERMGSFVSRINWARRDARIRFAFQPRNCVGDVAAVAHIERVLDWLLARSAPNCAYKIGVTYWPFSRMMKKHGQDTDYSRPDRRMIVAYVADNCDDTCRLEKLMIARHRYVDRSGILTGGGSPRCQNRALGGESAGHALPPHFLYVITGGNYGWHP